jgi:hypothetical protein
VYIIADSGPVFGWVIVAENENFFSTTYSYL